MFNAHIEECSLNAKLQTRLQYMYPERLVYFYRIGKFEYLDVYDNVKHLVSLPYKAFPDVQSCMLYILSVNDYSQLPKVINLNYKDFIEPVLPLGDLINSLRICIALTTYRLNLGYESVRINFRIQEPITQSFSNYLENIGIDNLTPDPGFYTLDQIRENVELIIRGIRSWPDYLIDGHKKLEIQQLPNSANNIKLTPRQGEIIKLITNRGYSNKQIAQHLKISESAVKLHVGIMLKKIGCRNRTQLVRSISEGLTA